MPDGGGVPLQNMVALRFNHGDSGNGGTVWIKAKLLQFFENYRPAFYGTWRRRSYAIGPRRPFTKDCYQLDYEVDSDDEWEEEEPGENISQSDVRHFLTINNLLVASCVDILCRFRWDQSKGISHVMLLHNWI